MDFIYALLDALMPSRVAKAEAESFRDGLVRLNARPQAEPTTLEQLALHRR